MSSTVYASKVDLWLAALIAAAVLGEVTAVTALALSPVEGRWYLIALMTALGIVFPIWIFTTTSYQLAEHELTIRSGPFTWRVPLDSITGVKPTRNPLSSPALSLDRLEITYGAGRRIMISPRHRTDFLAALEMGRRAEGH